MKLFINFVLSLVVMAACLWLVWPSAENAEHLDAVFSELTLSGFLPYLAGFIGLMGFTHFFRAWRWNNLLHPIGVHLNTRRLLVISSVGYMAILALPARLGEFVRPALVRKKGDVSGSAVLGTIAVERVVDGLLISVMVVSCAFVRNGPDAPSWMMPMAYIALSIFSSATVFLILALRWPQQTVRLSVALTLTPKFWPKFATKLEGFLHKLISGFTVLKDWSNLAKFVFWSALYWSCNAVGMWILALGFGMPLPLVGAFATMGIIAVGITLPNAPGLVGQFHWLTILGLTLYLSEEVVASTALAYAIVLHGVQVVWYLGWGGIAMTTGDIHFSEIWASFRKDTPDTQSPSS